jgi:hypothetical protein
MKGNTSCIFTAGILLALALIFSCSSNDNGTGPSTGDVDKDKCAQENQDQTLRYILKECKINGENLSELYNAFNAMNNTGLGTCTHEELLGALDKTPAQIEMYCNEPRDGNSSSSNEGDDSSSSGVVGNPQGSSSSNNGNGQSSSSTGGNGASSSSNNIATSSSSTGGNGGSSSSSTGGSSSGTGGSSSSNNDGNKLYCGYSGFETCIAAPNTITKPLFEEVDKCPEFYGEANAFVVSDKEGCQNMTYSVSNTANGSDIEIFCATASGCAPIAPADRLNDMTAGEACEEKTTGVTKGTVKTRAQCTSFAQGWSAKLSR